ncbi:MAG: SLC13 family permease [Candidatus Thermoplasmatota archaeon]
MPLQHLAPAAAAAVFAATFTLLAMGRLGKWPVPRGAAALGGGLLTALLLGVGWSAIDLQVILLIVGLMAFASLAEEAGAFAGLRRTLDRLPPRLALWICLLITALASAALLNDAAIVVLVPYLIPELRRLGLDPAVSVILMAVAANLGSLLTPFGNPQNAVLAQAAHLSLVDFLVAQALPVAFGLALLGIAAWRARVEPGQEPPVAPLRPRGRAWLLACFALFIGLAAWPDRPIGLGTTAAASAALAWLGLRPILLRDADRAVVRSLDWNVIALFVGLYLLTGGLSQWAPQPDLSVLLDDPVRAAAGVTALSNTIGNVPAVLTLLRIDETWSIAHAMFLVSVSTLGGALFLTGSAASLLAADQARRHGISIRFVPFLRHAAPWTLPVLVLAAWLHW